MTQGESGRSAFFDFLAVFKMNSIAPLKASLSGFDHRHLPVYLIV